MADNQKRLESLPASFRFGVATADHQCEAHDPRWPDDIWDWWEHQYAGDLEARSQANDFWHRFEGDIRRARYLGCGFFRFSIAWARVEDTPGHFNEEALDHYAEVVRAIAAHQMTPMITLLHNNWPLHVKERGGMLAEDFPAWFASYAEKVAERVHDELGEREVYWVTFNEPTNLVEGYFQFWWLQGLNLHAMPPGIPAGTSDDEIVAYVTRLMRNLFAAHAVARTRIRERWGDRAKVGANPEFFGLPPWFRRWVDAQAKHLGDEHFLRAQVRRISARSLPVHGDADVVVAALSATGDRAQRVALSDPYLVTSQRLLVPSDSPVQGPADLPGKVVAVVRRTTADRYAPRLVPGARIRRYHNHPAARAALRSGQASALLGDAAILASASDEGFKLVGEPLRRESYVVGVPHGHPDLQSRVNLAIDRFKQEKTPGAAERHLTLFGSSAGQAPYLRLAPRRASHDHAELGRADVHALVETDPPASSTTPKGRLKHIKDRGHLVAAVHHDLPGLGFRDPKTGEYEGLEIDLVRTIAREIFHDDPEPSAPSGQAGDIARKIRFTGVASGERVAQVHDSPLSLSWLIGAILGLAVPNMGALRSLVGLPGVNLALKLIGLALLVAIQPSVKLLPMPILGGIFGIPPVALLTQLLGLWIFLSLPGVQRILKVPAIGIFLAIALTIWLRVVSPPAILATVAQVPFILAILLIVALGSIVFRAAIGTFPLYYPFAIGLAILGVVALLVWIDLALVPLAESIAPDATGVGTLTSWMLSPRLVWPATVVWLGAIVSSPPLQWLLGQLDQFVTRFLKTVTLLSTWFLSDWWSLGMRGELAESLCPKEFQGQLDFVGLDYYWGAKGFDLRRILAFAAAVEVRYDQAPVWAEALGEKLREYEEWFPGKNIIICENGSVDVADGVSRAEYLAQHLRQVQLAVQERAERNKTRGPEAQGNVIGYVCWTIASNREWGQKFGPSNDFGLYYVDLNHDPKLKRLPRDGKAYQMLIDQALGRTIDHGLEPEPEE